MQIEKLLCDGYIPFKASATIADCLVNIEYGDSCSHIVLNSNNIPVGVISNIDLLRASEKGLVADHMTSTFVTISNYNQLMSVIENKNYFKTPIVYVTQNPNKKEECLYAGVVSKEKVMSHLVKKINHLNMILDTFNFGIASIDSNADTLFVNEEFTRIHTLPSPESIMDDEHFLDSFGSSPIYDALSTDGTLLKENNIPLENDYSHTTIIPYYRSLTNDNGEIVGAVVTVQEYDKVNDFSMSVKDLNLVADIFAKTFNELSEMVFVVDSNLLILYSNPSFIKVMGQKYGNTLNNEKLRDMISNYFNSESNSVHKTEVKLKLSMPTTISVAITCIPILRNESLMAVAVIMRDKTTIDRLSENVETNKNLLRLYEKKLNKNYDDMIVINPQNERMIESATKIASHPVSVLIEGENGVGKELVANYIHSHSNRSDKPFVPINCGAIPENLWESEMFGYEEGAFTGAKKGGKIGYLELANHGTVFLDEVSELPFPMQVKLLRFLQNMEIRRVGGNKNIKLDVRVISASNKSLDKMVTEGTFRIDLYYRLNVVHLFVPPLRERRDEILPLANHFLSIFRKKYHKSVKLSDDAEDILIQQSWPGNIRQLQNAIEYSVAMCNNIITPDDLPRQLNSLVIESNESEIPDDLSEYERDNGKSDNEPASYTNKNDILSQVQKLEKELIAKALIETGNNRTKAMEHLGMSRKTFYKKLKQYDFL